MIGVDINKYWEERKNLNYYKLIRKIIESFSPGESIMDVGSYGTPIVTYGNFKKRISVDRINTNIEGVDNIVGNWLTMDAPKVDLILCLQVLEHIPEEKVRPFARKLLKHGTNAIISLPYMWPVNSCKYHVHDLIDLEKIEDWLGQKSLSHTIVSDRNVKRIITTFKEN